MCLVGRRCRKCKIITLTTDLNDAIIIKLGSKELEGEPDLTQREKPAEMKGASFDWKLECSKRVSLSQGAGVER
jgi:hypothetical protein